MQKFTLLLAAALLGSTLSVQAVNFKHHGNSAKHRMEISKTKPVKQLNTAATRLGDTPPITEPKGEPTFYAETTYGFVNYWGMPAGSASTYPNNIWFDGDDVYLQNPIPAAKFLSYVKGTKTEAGISVVLPQALGDIYDEEYDENYTLYLNVLKLVVTPDEDDPDNPAAWYVNYPEEMTIEYTLDEDGSYSLNIPGNTLDETVGLPLYMIGIVYDLEEDNEDSWSCYANYDETYFEFTEEPITLPDGVNAEKWGLLYDGDGRYVNIAFDGDDVYLGNLYEEVPDSYVKGTVKDGVVTFPMTYLGISEEYGEFIFFTPATWETICDEEWDEEYEDYLVAEEFVFNYDAEAKKMEARDEYSAIYITSPAVVGEMVPSYFEYFFEPTIAWQNPETANAAPQNPEFIGLYDYREWYGCDIVEFDLPSINVNGNLLDTKEMYYTVYIDGEQLVFEPDEYIGLTEAMSEIPYNFTDSENEDIYSYGTNHQICIYSEGYETVGVQLFYKGTDGNIYKSERITKTVDQLLDLAEGGDGVESILNGANVTSENYINLAGVKVSNPEKGIFIKTTTLSDGSRRVSKVVIK